MTSCGTFQKLRPLSLLAHLSSCYDSAQLTVSNNLVSWSIYLDQGKIVYASHSVAPFDRLDCHLHRLSHQVPTIASETRTQLRLLFETESNSSAIPYPEYQAISWLVEGQYLNSVEASVLVEGLVKEVIESFLLVREGTYEFGNQLDAALPTFCQLDLQPIVDYCQDRLRGWQGLAPQIWSPYQRPYILGRQRSSQQIAPVVQQRLNALLKGFSFRQLAVLLNQDELQLARSLYPYAVNGTILLQEPHPPFDQLPRLLEQLPPTSATSATEATHKPPPPIGTISIDRTATIPKIFPDGQPAEIPSPANEHSNPTKISTSELGGATKSQFPLPVSPPPVEPSGNNFAVPVSPPPTAPTATPVPTGKISSSPAGQGVYTIVCVDDSQSMLNQLRRFLDDESFSVHTINNPVKALMQIVRLKPDLILLDIRMAGIDGYELCKLLRNHPVFRQTPIVMVTANTGLIDRVKARMVGASGYLTKPFKQADLLKIIFKQLS